VQALEQVVRLGQDEGNEFVQWAEESPVEM